MSRVLENIRVIDISQVAAVPMAARHLADFGADVVHVEHPVSGDTWRNHQNGLPGGTYGATSKIKYEWENFNRNKRSLTVDISKPAGQEIIYKMVKDFDIFLSNLRPYEIEKYKLDYKTLKQINPRIICGNLTGFGKKGNDKDSPAYDYSAFWLRSGMSHLFSTQNVLPVLHLPSAVGDSTAALILALGILMALFEREKTGLGQEVDVSLLHAGQSLIGVDLSGSLNTGIDVTQYTPQPPAGIMNEVQKVFNLLLKTNRERAINPLSGRYTTKDNKVITLVGLNANRYWPNFCRAMGIAELENDSRFNSFDARKENAQTLLAILDRKFMERTLEEWQPILRSIPYTWTQNLVESANDPQAIINDNFISYENPNYGVVQGMASPMKLSRTPADIRMPAPEFGQNTEEVLLEIGCSWEDIERLRQNKVI